MQIVSVVTGRFMSFLYDHHVELKKKDGTATVYMLF